MVCIDHVHSCDIRGGSKYSIDLNRHHILYSDWSVCVFACMSMSVTAAKQLFFITRLNWILAVQKCMHVLIDEYGEKMQIIDNEAAEAAK